MLHILSYDDRLKRLWLTHLDKRRDRSDLVEAYEIIKSDKIINGVHNVQSEMFLSLIKLVGEVI